MQLLAILGRGIRQNSSGSWFPTRDTEIFGEDFTPIARQLPPDDTNPNCFVAGGEPNLLAGRELCVRSRETLQTVVCAYGGRSPYLVETDAPSESEVLSDFLTKLLPDSSRLKIIVWPKERETENGKTNTEQELWNVFELALDRGYTDVGIVTVFVHYPRTLLMAERHLRLPHLSDLQLQCFVSEDVILQSHPKEGGNIRALHGSQAFMRTLHYEQRGINRLLEGTY